MSVPRVTRPSAQAQAPQRTALAMGVIMTGVGFRILQGIGGAFIMANSGAVIADLYPRELRGRAHGFTSGLHAAFCASMGFMALAAALSALRARRS